VYGYYLAGIAGSTYGAGMDICVVCCQIEVSATGRTLVQRSPTDCGVSVFVCVYERERERERERLSVIRCYSNRLLYKE